MKILVTGCGGQLASEIYSKRNNYKNLNFTFTDSSDLDITDYNKSNFFLKSHNFNFIINCAAYTNVEKSEINKDLADNVNHIGVLNLSKIAKKNEIGLIHISTDYVFDGNSDFAYDESCLTNPINYYGYSKLCGEKSLKKINPKNSIIIRTSWLYSKHGKNFVKTILDAAINKSELKIISDQVGSPTYAGDLADVILNNIKEINNDDVEIFHYSNEGSCSWYDFAKHIFEIKDISSKKIMPSLTKDHNLMASRPAFSVMDKSKIKSRFNLDIPCWKNSLKYFLTKQI